jgi:hypothetical protein
MALMTFVLVGGGCGGGGSGVPIGINEGGVTGNYNFAVLEGTWELRNGSGTAAVNVEGTSVALLATAKSGIVKISSIEELGDGTAFADVWMESVWHVVGTTPWGRYQEDVFLSSPGAENGSTSSEFLRKTGANTFVYDYTGERSGTVTITLLSSKTAKVAHNDRSYIYDFSCNLEYYLEKR